MLFSFSLSNPASCSVQAQHKRNPVLGRPWAGLWEAAFLLAGHKNQQKGNDFFRPLIHRQMLDVLLLDRGRLHRWVGCWLGQLLGCSLGERFARSERFAVCGVEFELQPVNDLHTVIPV